MTEKYKTANNKKKQRLNINSLNDFNKALIDEGYEEISFEENKFKEDIIKTFKLENSVIDSMYKYLNNSEVTYRADNIKNFIEYMENIKLFNDEHNSLIEEIKNINKLNIDRVEYERVISTQDDVNHMINDIEQIKKSVSKKVNSNALSILDDIEKELDNDYVYTRDIELLKKIVGNKIKSESYNHKTKVKTICIEVPYEITLDYIPAKLGSIEYHNHIKNNIPRIKRLRKNIKKYMVVNKDKSVNINQTELLQDTINIAVAVYDNKEFKAVSGSNDIDKFCTSPKESDATFTSSKVNKLGQLGIGYNRANDSEKKIFEEIHKQIELGKIKDYGNLELYSKWEPCPSCYYVISQFCKKHPNINVKVKYSKEYGHIC